MDWRICGMHTDYLADLRQLYLNSRTQTFTWLDASTAKLDDFDKATQDEVVLVAISDERPIGFVSWWPPDNFIHNLYVDPHFFRQGIGRALLAGCLEKLERPATLKCLQQNTNAISFYQTQGWVIKEEGTSDEGAYFLLIFHE
ncbi:GNAT family N-acetyltransferase [Spirosoma endbachense]|uniref:GNAT family N-acetyltransferase n=1 Tax=Spirosoma endbachense TaxID=2666025 RepID=A0A6P1VYI8_9BACT|nr:GNAT family N-acetyltransferase [Spirosoma endbachense]QHV98213.1 GNAT family N-acetyltransferase [Spirosoma endbachense]